MSTTKPVAMNLHPLSYLSQIMPLSNELRTRLAFLLRTAELKKKTYLLNEGEVSNYIYFIEKGLIRIFYLEDGNQICSGLLCEGGMAISVKSFFDRSPSDEFIQTIEDTIVHYISYYELESLYREFPEFNVIGRVLITKHYMMSEERNFLLRKHSATRKYQLFQERLPHLAGRVPRKDIASYLGINLETLSRLDYRI